MNKTPTTPDKEADSGLSTALLLRAAEESCQPRTVLFEAIAEAEEEPTNTRLYASLMELEAYEAAHPGSGERIDEAVRRLALLAADITAGNFRTAHVTDMLRLLDYDEALRRAEEAGELRGRNEVIRRQLDRDFGGDGLPPVSGGASAGSPRRTPNIFDLAAQA